MEVPEEQQRLHVDCDCDSHPHPPQIPPPDDGGGGGGPGPGSTPGDDRESTTHKNKHNNDSDNDYSDSDYSDSDDCDINTSAKHPAKYDIMFQGTVIVPSFTPGDPGGHRTEASRIGQSLGNMPGPAGHCPLSPKHQELVWAGSSMGTMHYGQLQPSMQPVPIYSLGRPGVTGSRVSGLQKTPSVMSRSQMGSMFGSQTVSESGTDMYSFCRICQMQGTDRDPLISPCRCAGTLRYIHSSCLKKWIRISQRRGKKQPPRCELCHYQFNRHKRFKFSQWRWPKVRRRDKILHIIFLLNLVIMIGCAIATVMCFLSDRGSVVKFPKDKVRLTTEEVITLTCGVMFFVAFFIAMTVEIKARHTLYKLFRRFVMHNTEWTVEQYDPGKDPYVCRRGPASIV